MQRGEAGVTRMDVSVDEQANLRKAREQEEKAKQEAYLAGEIAKLKAKACL